MNDFIYNKLSWKLNTLSDLALTLSHKGILIVFLNINFKNVNERERGWEREGERVRERERGKERERETVNGSIFFIIILTATSGIKTCNWLNHPCPLNIRDRESHKMLTHTDTLSVPYTSSPETFWRSYAQLTSAHETVDGNWPSVLVKSEICKWSDTNICDILKWTSIYNLYKVWTPRKGYFG